jgi:hypothetical protein
VTGTIYNLSRSQQIDGNSKVIGGALLYIYAAGTTTPSDTFTDFLLTQINPWPVEADSAGRFPAIWVADGAYRARMTDSNAILIFDDDNVQAIGPSTGTPVGPGIDTTSVRLTGDFFWAPVDTTRAGAVRANGRTIGSVSSGATERANADTQPLFEFLWNNFSNAKCPVSGGRGVSAVADFNANKTIVTYDMRGMTNFGLDTMGSSARGVLTPATSIIQGGVESSTALLSHTHGAGSFAAASHSHDAGTYAVGTGITTNLSNNTLISQNETQNSVSNTTTGGGGSRVASLSFNQVTIGASSSLNSGSVSGNSGSTNPGVVGTSASAGSGSSFNLMNPYSTGTWYIKL